MKRKVNLAIITADEVSGIKAVLEASKDGGLPSVNLKFVAATVIDSLSIEAAKKSGVAYYAYDFESLEATEFNKQLAETLIKENIQLVFLVDCRAKIILVPSKIAFKEVYFAGRSIMDQYEPSGLGAYKNALERIKHHVKSKDLLPFGPFRVTLDMCAAANGKNYSQEGSFLANELCIPTAIAIPYLNEEKDLEIAAEELRRYVRRYLGEFLVYAAEIAAQQILDDAKEFAFK